MLNTHWGSTIWPTFYLHLATRLSSIWTATLGQRMCSSDCWAGSCYTFLSRTGTTVKQNSHRPPRFLKHFLRAVLPTNKKQKLKGTAPAAEGSKLCITRRRHTLTISSSKWSLTFVFILIVSENENFHRLASGNTCMRARQHMTSLAISSIVWNTVTFSYKFVPK